MDVRTYTTDALTQTKDDDFFQILSVSRLVWVKICWCVSTAHRRICLCPYHIKILKIRHSIRANNIQLDPDDFSLSKFRVDMVSIYLIFFMIPFRW